MAAANLRHTDVWLLRFQDDGELFLVREAAPVGAFLARRIGIGVSVKPLFTDTSLAALLALRSVLNQAYDFVSGCDSRTGRFPA
jgi:hypothetical protein